jgi:hypothetical protein
MKRIFILLALFLLKSVAFAQVNSFAIDSAKLNRPLMLTLDTLYKEDQESRMKISMASKDHAPTDSLWKVIREKDSLNLVKVNLILDKYGWLGPQDVGINGSQALFLVIQHANLGVQEKYLPMIRQAVKDGKTLSSNLALLEDRVNMRQGKPQIYGSQVFTNKKTGKFCFYPIADPDHVDEKRKTMGLQPIAEYSKLFKIDWNVEEYKKMLPEIEEAAKHR